MKRKFIATNISEYLNENELFNIDFNSFPNDILKTLEEYGHYYLNNFDWNSKQNEIFG